MADPLGSTFEDTATLPDMPGTVTLLPPEPSSEGDHKDVDMDAMLQQMQRSVMAAHERRPPSSAALADSIVLPTRHHSLSEGTRSSPPKPLPEASPAQSADMATLFESLLQPPAHDHTEGCIEPTSMVLMGGGAGASHDADFGRAATRSPSLPPAEISSSRPSGFPDAIVPMEPNWLDDAVVRDVLRARWLQLREVWDVTSQRVSKAVRMCEGIVADSVAVAMMSKEAFAPPAAINRRLVLELQAHLTALTKQLTESDIIIWNARKNLRDIAKHLYHARIPLLPAWRDEVGSQIVQHFNKAMKTLSARRGAPRPV